MPAGGPGRSRSPGTRDHDPAGKREPWQHRQPEAEPPEQQGGRQCDRQGDAGESESGHRGGFERAEPARHEPDRAQQRCEHEAREHGGGTRSDAERADEHPHGRRVEREDRELQHRCAQQQVRITHEQGVGGAEQFQRMTDARDSQQPAAVPARRAAREGQHHGRQRPAEEQEQRGRRDHQAVCVPAMHEDHECRAEAQHVRGEVAADVDRDGRPHGGPAHATLLERGGDRSSTAQSHGRQRLVDEQLLQAEAARVAERHGGAGPVQHGQPRAGLGEVGRRLQRERRQQPLRLGLFHQPDERTLFGEMQRPEHDGRQRGRPDQPRQPVVCSADVHGLGLRGVSPRPREPHAAPGHAAAPSRGAAAGPRDPAGVVGLGVIHRWAPPARQAE